MRGCVIDGICHFSQYKLSDAELIKECGNIADGDVLSQYALLPHGWRTEIGKSTGVEPDEVGDLSCRCLSLTVSICRSRIISMTPALCISSWLIIYSGAFMFVIGFVFDR